MKCKKCGVALVYRPVKPKFPWLLSGWAIALFSLVALGGDLAYKRGEMKGLLDEVSEGLCPNCDSSKSVI